MKRWIGNRSTGGLSRAARACLLAGAVLGVSGCASIGPVSVDRDRFDYIQAADGHLHAPDGGPFPEGHHLMAAALAVAL